MSAQVPSAGTALATLVRVTLMRLFRGRAVMLSVLIAALPIAMAAALSGQHGSLDPINAVQFLVLLLLPPMFIASSVGEEIEDRTTTYLWSRPIPRWTIIIGKLLALAPVALVLVTGGFFLSRHIFTGQAPSGTGIAGIAAGTLAIAALSAGLATLVPRHGMSLAIAYLVIIDLPIGAIPASISSISITRQVSLLIDGAKTTQPAITLAVIAGLWLAIAMWRIRRLES